MQLLLITNILKKNEEILISNKKIKGLKSSRIISNKIITVITTTFTRRETMYLLYNFCNVYHMQIFEILLTGLSACFNSWEKKPFIEFNTKIIGIGIGKKIINDAASR